MQLILNTYGCFLRKKDKCFLVKKEDNVFEVSSKKVKSILITTGAYLSTDAVKLAMENNIDIIFLDDFGNPFSRIWHAKPGSTTLIRRRQLEIADKSEGLELAKEWILKKFKNQTDFLKKLKKTRPKKKEKLEEYIKSLQDMSEKISLLEGTIKERRGTIMGFEGTAGKIYFSAISYVMPDKFKFNGRSRQPAKDEFNCLLNYGYGVLYSLVEKACIISGLDPYIGFIHTDNYKKKSLTFDLIENFRIFADETAVYLFSQRKVKQGYFEKLQNGMTLNKDGKAVLLEHLNKNLDKKIRYRGRNIKKRDVIQFECHRIANQLIKNKLK